MTLRYDHLNCKDERKYKRVKGRREGAKEKRKGESERRAKEMRGGEGKGRWRGGSLTLSCKYKIHIRCKDLMQTLFRGRHQTCLLVHFVAINTTSWSG